MPTSTSAAMTSEVAIGRLMNGVEMLMRVSRPPAPACAGGGGR